MTSSCFSVVILSLPSSAPVGVLFSVEVMSSHFALRHYVPCFFSAACGGLTFRLFSLWSGDGGNGGPDQHLLPHSEQGKGFFYGH